MNNRWKVLLVLAIGLLGLSAMSASAFDLGDIAVHGFVTQTLAKSTANQVFTIDSEGGSADWFEAGINFTGNVEGTDLFQDRADVVVCDGFVGNVAIKVAEGIGEAVLSVLREGIRGNPIRRLGALTLRPMFGFLKKRMDYAEYGGVPLLITPEHPDRFVETLSAGT